MRAKQKNLRIFEINITNDQDFFAYMEKNLILLKDFFLFLQGKISDDVIAYLDEKGLCYKIAENCNIKIPSKQTTTENSAIISQEEPKNKPNIALSTTRIVKEYIKTLLIEQPIRSGREVIHEGDVTIFGRVNSAAKVIASGNVEVYGIIDGMVQSDGDYMIIKELGKGYIIFNGDILERELFDGSIKKVTKDKNGALIKDLFETAHY